MRVPEPLWAVQIAGPGSVFAMPSRGFAEAKIAEWNKQFDEAFSKFREKFGYSKYDPSVKAVLIHWPGNPFTHARDLESHQGNPVELF